MRAHAELLRDALYAAPEGYPEIYRHGFEPALEHLMWRATSALATGDATDHEQVRDYLRRWCALPGRRYSVWRWAVKRLPNDLAHRMLRVAYPLFDAGQPQALVQTLIDRRECDPDEREEDELRMALALDMATPDSPLQMTEGMRSLVLTTSAARGAVRASSGNLRFLSVDPYVLLDIDPEMHIHLNLSDLETEKVEAAWLRDFSEEEGARLLRNLQWAFSWASEVGIPIAWSQGVRQAALWTGASIQTLQRWMGSTWLKDLEGVGSRWRPSERWPTTGPWSWVDPDVRGLLLEAWGVPRRVTLPMFIDRPTVPSSMVPAMRLEEIQARTPKKRKKQR